MIHVTNFCENCETTAAENGRLRERVELLKAARNWLGNIYMNATSDDAGEDFRYYFEANEILEIEAVLDATAEGGE